MNFKELTKQVLSISEVIENHEKMSTDEIIIKYPQGVTLIRFDLLTNGEGGEYAVFNFKENLMAYFNGGALLTKMAKSWIQACNGDIKEASDQLTISGGLKVVLSRGKSKKGQPVTIVKVVE